MYRRDNRSAELAAHQDVVSFQEMWGAYYDVVESKVLTIYFTLLITLS